jgi:two-component sensor histidine kinase
MAHDTPPFVTDALALALVAASDAPILLLDGDLDVVAASDSFARAFQLSPAAIAGQSLFALGAGEWDVPQLRSLLRLTLSGAPVGDYEMDLKRPGRGERRLVLTCHQLAYGDDAEVRLLLAVSDVTDARLAERLKDDLLREKAILYQELQHRVANSLQIIASVLMQSARRVPSAQIRSHLYDAHSRVMSVAALQNQLTASKTLGAVQLRAYFTELCQSIGASMIQDREKLRLRVEADDAEAAPDVSVSLGLIVTELVINALKHAFPDDRSGDIVVSYLSRAADWTLSVTDSGVGFPSTETTKPGLGTSIVEALAKQLDATVSLGDAHPGARVSIVHAAGAVHTGVAL